jgi:hypothetical protein
MTQKIDKLVKCGKCATKWSEEIASCEANDNYEKHYTTDLSEYNNGYIFNGVFAIKGMIDYNINHTDKCRICMNPLKNDRLVGGDNFRYHDSCFFGRYGYID